MCQRIALCRIITDHLLAGIICVLLFLVDVLIIYHQVVYLHRANTLCERPCDWVWITRRNNLVVSYPCLCLDVSSTINQYKWISFPWPLGMDQPIATVRYIPIPTGCLLFRTCVKDSISYWLDRYGFQILMVVVKHDKD